MSLTIENIAYPYRKKKLMKPTTFEYTYCKACSYVLRILFIAIAHIAYNYC